MSGEIRKYIVVTSIAAHPCDAVLVALLEDDRALRQGDLLKTAFFDEAQWAAGLNDKVWDRLASIVGAGAPGIRHSCMKAISIAGGYISRRSFSVLQTLPFRLATGSIPDNLRDLAALPDPPAEDMSYKLWHLMKLKYNEEVLIQTVAKLTDISWTTTGAEQSHGSVAIVHRFHNMFGTSSLSQRSFLALTRPLFTPSQAEIEGARMRQRLEALNRRRLERITGRHIYLGELMATAKVELQGRKLPQELMTNILQQHAEKYRALPLARRLAYEHLAQQKVHEGRSDVDESIGVMTSRILLQKIRAAAVEADEGSKHRLGNCRLSQAQLHDLGVMYDSHMFGKSAVEQLFADTIQAPEQPSADEQQHLELYGVSDGPEPPPLAKWAKKVCKNRELFSDCALCIVGASKIDWYYFNFAVMSPMSVSLMRLHPLQVYRPCVAGLSFDQQVVAAERHFEYEFELEKWAFVEASDVPASIDDAIYVLPHMAMASDSRMRSHGDLIPMSSFLPPDAPGHKEGGKAERKTRQKHSDAGSLLEPFPWLANYLSEPGLRGDQGARAFKDVAPLEEDVAAAAFAALEGKRAETAGLDAPASDFRTSIRGGRWTATNVGVPFDSVRGQASGVEPARFCRLFKLTKTATFAYRLYGDRVAESLAQFWCERLQHFYTIFVSSGQGDAFVFCAEDIAAAPTSTVGLDGALE